MVLSKSYAQIGWLNLGIMELHKLGLNFLFDNREIKKLNFNPLYKIGHEIWPKPYQNLGDFHAFSG